MGPVSFNTALSATAGGPVYGPNGDYARHALPPSEVVPQAVQANIARSDQPLPVNSSVSLPIGSLNKRAEDEIPSEEDWRKWIQEMNQICAISKAGDPNRVFNNKKSVKAACKMYTKMLPSMISKRDNSKDEASNEAPMEARTLDSNTQIRDGVRMMRAELLRKHRLMEDTDGELDWTPPIIGPIRFNPDDIRSLIVDQISDLERKLRLKDPLSFWQSKVMGNRPNNQILDRTLKRSREECKTILHNFISSAQEPKNRVMLEIQRVRFMNMAMNSKVLATSWKMELLDQVDFWATWYRMDLRPMELDEIQKEVTEQLIGRLGGTVKTMLGPYPDQMETLFD